MRRLVEAAMHGAVSASLVIEQLGLPSSTFRRQGALERSLCRRSAGHAAEQDIARPIATVSGHLDRLVY